MEDFLNSLPARVLIVIATASLIACLLPLIFLSDIYLNPLLMKWVNVILFGVLTGLLSCILLHGRSSGIRYATSIAGLMIGFSILGNLTFNYIGFDWKNQMEIIEALQWASEVAAAGLAAGFIIRTWNAAAIKVKIPTATSSSTVSDSARKRRTKVSSPRNKTNRIKNRRSSKKSVKVNSRRGEVRVRGRIIQPSRFTPSKNSQSNIFFKTIQAGLQNIFQDALSAKDHLRERINRRSYTKLTEPRPKILQSGSSRTLENHVRLSGEIEHRCPFCLETVNLKDPRGIKVCPVCHTRHHLDCWELTGTCQVPHQSN